MIRFLSFLGGIAYTILWYQSVIQGDPIKYITGITLTIIFIFINVLCK